MLVVIGLIAVTTIFGPRTVREEPSQSVALPHRAEPLTVAFRAVTATPTTTTTSRSVTTRTTRTSRTYKRITPVPPLPLPPRASNPNAATAIATALAQVGKPYRYGGAGPGSFDCSGLVMVAWRAAGVALPHNTKAQWRTAAHVDVAHLEPGDLIFSNRFGHVSLYLGDGRVVHAPHRGTVVTVAGLPSGIVGAARPE